jgi:hypothetical protein
MRVIDLTILVVQGKDIVDCFLRAIGSMAISFAFLLLEMPYRCDWIILLRNPGCRLENVPYVETHYAPADISDTSGDTKYRNSLHFTGLTTQLASNHTHLPGRSPSPPLRDVGPITNVTSKRKSWDPGRIRPSPLQRDVGGS